VVQFSGVSSEPTPTPVLTYSKNSTKTVKIVVKLAMKKNKHGINPDMDATLSSYIKGATFIYNDDKSYVAAILVVPEENVALVKKLLTSRKNEIQQGDVHTFDKTFHGLEDNYK
jgi:hypothetical protein